MSDKQQLVVLFGGRSCEHEVSVTSARSMLPHIDRTRFDVTLVGISKTGRWMLIDEAANVLSEATIDSAAAPNVLVDHAGASQLLIADSGGLRQRPVDVVFPLLHGPFGEDGTVQGLLELAGIATVGCGVAASAVGMDKEQAKRAFKAEGLLQVEFRVVRRTRFEERPDNVIFELERALPYPMYVKPARMGSSVGVSKAEDNHGLRTALAHAAEFDTKVIVEAAATGCREIECAVLGNEVPLASVLGEIRPSNEFYDYAAKYQSGDSELIIPARLNDALTEQVRTLAVRAFKAVGGSGLARVDFFVRPEDGTVLLNEINTMPGFTPNSMYPKLWEATGVPYGELISRLADLALDRHAQHARNRPGL